MIHTVVETELAVNEVLQIRKNRFSHGSGKRVCIVTGTHGDELEGQYVCYLLCKFLSENLEHLHGTVDVYPALNPLGIDSITRSVPTFDIDMNRTFPGNLNGTPLEYISAEIVRDLTGADFCIDIHASNIFLMEIPQIRINETTMSTLLPYSGMLNVDLVWIHSSATVLESTLAHSMNVRGVKTLVVEMGVGMRLTTTYCKRLFEGILNLLSSVGIYDGQAPAVRTPLICNTDDRVEFLNAESAGIFVAAPNMFGSMVEEHTYIGDIVDPLGGTVRQRVESPCHGLLFTIREYPVVNPGSLLGRIFCTDGRVE